MSITLYPAEAIGEEFSGHVQVHLCLRDGIEVYALGVAGPERVISFVAAGLSQGKGSFRFTFRQFPPAMQYPNVANKTEPVTVYPVGGGYQTHKHHLGYDTWHLLAVSRNRSFILQSGCDAADDQALWDNQLHSDRFTTPILRHWVPELRREMLANGLLRPCVGFGGVGHILVASDRTLDKLVTEGIRGGQLTFSADRAPAPLARSA